MDKHTCKHFNGTRNDKCAAGVTYRDVTINPDAPGSAFRKPCCLPDGWTSARMREMASTEPRGECASFQLPTKEEIDEHEKSLSAHVAKDIRVANKVHELKEQHNGKGFRGTIPCPECGGVLHVRIAACNGHAHVSCETEGCVRYLE